MARHGVVLVMTAQYLVSPLTDHFHGVRDATTKRPGYCLHLRRHLLTRTFPQHDEPTVPMMATTVGTAEKRKRLRFPKSPILPMLDGVATELQHARFLAVEFEVTVRQAFLHPRREALGVLSVLKAHDHVIGEAHDGHFPASMLTSPAFRPQIKGIVSVNVRQ